MHQKRSNKKWTINEVLKLEREYELLGLDIVDIASRHQRSADGIAYKLKSEGFIDKVENARGYFNDMPPVGKNKVKLPYHALAEGHLRLEKCEDVIPNVINVDIPLDVRLSALEMVVERINASLSLLALSKKSSSVSAW
jgi:hypothetical protein